VFEGGGAGAPLVGGEGMEFGAECVDWFVVGGGCGGGCAVVWFEGGGGCCWFGGGGGGGLSSTTTYWWSYASFSNHGLVSTGCY